MNTADATTALFAEHLVLEETRVAAWLPGAVDAEAVAAQGLALMRALAVIEDAAPRAEDEPGGDSALQRLEAKVDLLAALVGGLAAGMQPAERALAIRWSATGAELPAAAAPAGVAAGDAGCLRIVPSLLLPTPLRVPATVAACDDGRILVRFDPPDLAFADALERLVFRIHRREIARQRNSTPP